MFKVYFTDSEDNSSLIAEVKSDIEACQLALALHQSSNLHHVVYVRDNDFVDILKLYSVKH